MELLGTVDWLVHHEGVAMDVASVRVGLERWPAGGAKARARKLELFNERLIGLAIERLKQSGPHGGANAAGP